MTTQTVVITEAIKQELRDLLILRGFVEVKDDPYLRAFLLEKHFGTLGTIEVGSGDEESYPSLALQQDDYDSRVWFGEFPNMGKLINAIDLLDRLLSGLLESRE